MNPIYLDYNASTPLLPEVAAAMRPYMEAAYGNPSSMHAFGIASRKAVEAAREQVALLLNCFPDEIIFTSGGTESNNFAIKGAAFALLKKGNHIITSVVEHPAVSQVCHYLEGMGFRVTFIPVDRYGMVDPDAIRKAITPQTILITIMHSNNEVGTIQPIQEISAIAQEYKIVVHTDAAQSVGKIPVDVKSDGVDLLSVAGHKLYAPKGVGALYIRRGIRIEKLIHGADHEQNLRAGTENVLEIVGLGKAAEMAISNRDTFLRRTKILKERLYERIKNEIPDVLVNGHPVDCLPNTLSLSFAGIDAAALLSSTPAIAASPGAACHSGQVTTSAVIEAMNIPKIHAMGTVRFSLGIMTTEQEIDAAAEAIVHSVKRMKPDGDGSSPAMPLQDLVRLTDFTHAMGCACKIRPQTLEQILSSLPPVRVPEILVGPDHSDDAAVYRITDDLALVATVDVIPPVVDDPRSFGAIAAANALSDVYAMGGIPIYALSIVGFPDKVLPLSILEQILTGASDKVREAGIQIVGGHTIEDAEPKFGLAVTGTVHPSRILRNRGSREGDFLVLTKPLGTGIIATAVKRGLASPDEASEAISVMSLLNKAASEATRGLRINACTDITGFGLLGHLKEMIRDTSTDALLTMANIPLIGKTWEFAAAGMISGGTRHNLDFAGDIVSFDDTVPELARFILADAQTSGGLLLSVHPDDAGKYLELFREKAGHEAHIIGTVINGNGNIRVMV